MKYLRKEQTQSLSCLMMIVLQTMRDKASICTLNNFFSQCFIKVLPPLTSHHCLGLTVPDKCPEDGLSGAPPGPSIDVSKSNGPVKISGRMLKATALSIAPSITKLYLICLSNWVVFPRLRKCLTWFKSRSWVIAQAQPTTVPFLFYICPEQSTGATHI